MDWLHVELLYGCRRRDQDGDDRKDETTHRYSFGSGKTSISLLLLSIPPPIPPLRCFLYHQRTSCCSSLGTSNSNSHGQLAFGSMVPLFSFLGRRIGLIRRNLIQLVFRYSGRLFLLLFLLLLLFLPWSLHSIWRQCRKGASFQ
jgi:hypothetical protein